MISLQSYLSSSKINAAQAKLVILGNEAADLDSMVSSITYGYLRSLQDAQLLALPVMPIPRVDFALRPEAVYLFHEAGVNLDDVVFSDEIDLAHLFATGAEMILVDHNRLAPQLERFNDRVAGIVDHHKDEGLYGDASPRLIQTIGSTASLVALEFARAGIGLSREVAILLGGTLLLDTVNLDPGAGRVTDADLDVAAHILPLCPRSQQEFFAIMQKEKFNVAGLSTHDLLRKDYKEFQVGTVHCGIGSVLLSVMDWLKLDPNLCGDIALFARARNLDVLFAMNGFADPDFRRELVVFCATRNDPAGLIDFLQKSGLDLTPLPYPEKIQGVHGFMGFYNQGNSEISRKKLQPLLASYYRTSGCA